MYTDKSKMASSKEQPCFYPSVYQNIQSVYEIFDDNFFTVETQVNAHHPLFVRIYKETIFKRNLYD